MPRFRIRRKPRYIPPQEPSWRAIDFVIPKTDIPVGDLREQTIPMDSNDPNGDQEHRLESWDGERWVLLAAARVPAGYAHVFAQELLYVTFSDIESMNRSQAPIGTIGTINGGVHEGSVYIRQSSGWMEVADGWRVVGATNEVEPEPAPSALVNPGMPENRHLDAGELGRDILYQTPNGDRLEIGQGDRESAGDLVFNAGRGDGANAIDGQIYFCQWDGQVETRMSMNELLNAVQEIREARNDINHAVEHCTARRQEAAVAAKHATRYAKRSERMAHRFGVLIAVTIFLWALHTILFR